MVFVGVLGLGPPGAFVLLRAAMIAAGAALQPCQRASLAGKYLKKEWLPTDWTWKCTMGFAPLKNECHASIGGMSRPLVPAAFGKKIIRSDGPSCVKNFTCILRIL